MGHLLRGTKRGHESIELRGVERPTRPDAAAQIDAERALVSMEAIRLRSSLIRVRGSCSREASEEKPVPKSSSAMAMP